MEKGEEIAHFSVGENITSDLNNRGNIQLAIEYLQKLADNGNARAFCLLGWYYFVDEKNVEKGIDLLIRVVEKGDIDGGL